jgi:hypothetical protein
MPWLPLVVNEGQPGRAEGTLVQIQQHLLLVADEGQVVTSSGTPVAATFSVQLAGSRVPHEIIDGQRVVVTGELIMRRLVIDAIEPVNSSSRNAVPGVNINDEDFTARHGSLTTIEPRLLAERDLTERGILMNAWTDHRTGTRMALAMDVAATQLALAPHYGDALAVIQSRWDHHLLEQIRASVDENILISFGNTLSVGLQLQASLTLLHLPIGLARSLARFPIEAVNIRSLITPV